MVLSSLLYPTVLGCAIDAGFHCHSSATNASMLTAAHMAGAPPSRPAAGPNAHPQHDRQGGQRHGFPHHRLAG